MNPPELLIPVDEKGLDRQTVSELIRKGHILILQEDDANQLEMVTCGMIINAPRDNVMRVLTDFEKFTEFMPSTIYCKPISNGDDWVDVKFRLEMKVAVVKIKTEYVNRHWKVSDKEIRFKLVPGRDDKLKESYGSWQLFELDGGEKTAVFYSNYSDLRNLSWVLKKAFDVEPSLDASIQASSAVMVVKALKMRVEDPSYSPNKKRKLAIF